MTADRNIFIKRRAYFHGHYHYTAISITAGSRYAFGYHQVWTPLATRNGLAWYGNLAKSDPQTMRKIRP